MLAATLLLAQSSTVYVSTTAGSRDADGSRDRPYATLAPAVRKAEDAGGGTVVVDAPADRPLREILDAKAEVNVTVKGANGAAWYISAGEPVRGWTRRSGAWEADWPSRSTLRGVWTGGDAAKTAVVWPLKRGDLTPGTFRVEDGALTVRLPGDADPSRAYLTASVRRSCVLVRNGRGKLTLLNGRFRGGYEGVVMIRDPKRGAHLAATDCSVMYGESGFRAVGATNESVLTRCTATSNENDGFNLHGGAGVKSVMRLIDCQGIGNGDEGASPHDDTMMYIDGGLYADNKSGGFTSIGNAYAEITGATFRNNHQAHYDATEGGIAFKGNSRGKVSRVKLEGNKGAPLYRAHPEAVRVEGGGR